MRKIISVLFALIFALTAAPLKTAQADVTPPTVWKIAVLTVPFVTYPSGTYAAEENDFAIYLKSLPAAECFIENASGGRVDIQYTYICLETPLPSSTPEAGGISFFDAWKIHDFSVYDSVFCFLPKTVSSASAYAYTTTGRGASRDGKPTFFCIFPTKYAQDETFAEDTLIHEFAHVTEMWFGEYMGYRYPFVYNINEKILLKDGFANYTTNNLSFVMPYSFIKGDTGFHSLIYMTPPGKIENYYPYNFSYNEKIYRWYSGTIPDPKYGEEGHVFQYMGVNPEMWQYTPRAYNPPNSGDGTYIPDIPPCPPEIIIPDSPYAITATDENGEIAGDVYIDLLNEKLGTYYNSGAPIAAYSIDGGVKWTTGYPQIPKLLDKPLKLVLTDMYDTRLKRPADGAKVITFPAIEARPKLNPLKLKPNYLEEADLSGQTPGNWVLSPNGTGAAVFEGYQIAKGTAAPVDAELWLDMPEKGVAVSAIKENYVVRSAPIVSGARIVPASKIFKITPAVQGKAPKIRADYRNEVIPLPANGAIDFNGSVYSVVKAEKYKISDILNVSGAQTVKLWTQATKTKPATERQVYTLAPRSAVETQTLQGVNGAVRLPNTLEILNPATKKWGALPKFTASVTLEKSIRLKPTAKANGVIDTGFAMSLPVDFSVEYGEYAPPARVGAIGKFGVLKIEVGDVAVALDEAA